MKERLPVGFMFKQINNIYEKEFNNLLRGIGITSSQCAVLDYLLGQKKHTISRKKWITTGRRSTGGLRSE